MSQNFPPIVSKVMLQYLDQQSISAFARVCKSHLCIIYFYAVSVLGWSGDSVARYFHDPMKKYPWEPFLQVQVAKIHFAALTTDKVVSKKPVNVLNVFKFGEYLLDNWEVFSNEKEPYPVTLSSYLTEIALFPRARDVVLSENAKESISVFANRMTNFYAREVLSLKSPTAKCRYAIATANYDEYVSTSDTIDRTSYQAFGDTLLRAAFEHFTLGEPRIFLKEFAKYGVICDEDRYGETLWELLSEVYEYDECVYEHPEVFHTMKSFFGDDCTQFLEYLGCLFISGKNGPQRCQRMIDDPRFELTHSDMARGLKLHSIFLSDCQDPDIESVKMFLEFEPTRKLCLKRLQKYLSTVESDEELEQLYDVYRAKKKSKTAPEGISEQSE